MSAAGPTPPTMDDAVEHGAVADATAVNPLVDTTWLAERVGTSEVALLQVDGDSSAYYTAHLPGALPIDWHDELHERVRRGPVTRAHFMVGRSGRAPRSYIPQRIRRCTGLRPSRASGRARA